jgi:putative transposase
MYLVAIIDLFRRYVVSWEMDQTLEVDFVLEAIKRASSIAKPEILNSDQGSQFTSPRYIEILEEAGVKISMAGRGRCIDNIFAERLWRSLKYEEVYLNDYDSSKAARKGVDRFLAGTIIHAPTKHLIIKPRQKFTTVFRQES